MPVTFRLNGAPITLDDDDPATPLLWAIREQAGLTGTKFGCGRSLCGACTVHLDGRAIRSCVTPLGSVAGREIHTIESLSPDRSHPLQKAWLAQNVPQCGYCQSGQLMSAAALLARNPNPSNAEIDAAAGHSSPVSEGVGGRRWRIGAGFHCRPRGRTLPATARHPGGRRRDG